MNRTICLRGETHVDYVICPDGPEVDAAVRKGNRKLRKLEIDAEIGPLEEGEAVEPGEQSEPWEFETAAEGAAAIAEWVQASGDDA